MRRTLGTTISVLEATGCCGGGFLIVNDLPSPTWALREDVSLPKAETGLPCRSKSSGVRPRLGTSDKSAGSCAVLFPHPHNGRTTGRPTVETRLLLLLGRWGAWGSDTVLGSPRGLLLILPWRLVHSVRGKVLFPLGKGLG